MKKREINFKAVFGFGLSIIGFFIAAYFLVNTVIQFSGQADEEGMDTLRDGIRRAAVQCYAIEGRYPPSVEYLTENYGIQIDYDRYHVFYSGFASNVMPDITVLPAETEQ